MRSVSFFFSQKLPMTMKILDHFFPIISSTGGKSDDSFFVPFILAGADDLWWSSSSFINNNNNNNNTHVYNKSSERTCARKPRKTSVSCARESPGLGSSNRRFTG